MNLHEFFESDDISLEIISYFNMWKKGECTKSECIAESKRILREYEDEDGERLIASMTYYWCLLNSNIVDNKLKTKLGSYSLQDIIIWYPEKGRVIYDILCSLLKEEPKPLNKEKTKYSKLRWKPGDVYAIPMPPDTKALCHFSQNEIVYTIIECEKIVSETSRNQNITAYIYLHFGEIETSLHDTMSTCIALPVRRVYTGENTFLYTFYFYDIAKNCPEEKLRYLGCFDNTKRVFENEHKTDDYLFCGWISWETLFRDVVHQYDFLKDIGQCET